jgi:ATP-dependent RNA helicase DeaD
MITFKETGLGNDMLRAVNELGFVNPTAVQEQTIPAILKSEKDVIALAQTGTGKTAGFGLPVLEKISESTKQVQAIVLCPTRELCLQITKDLTEYSKFKGHVAVTAVYGGSSIDTQIRKLKKGTQIVVGTPGRTLDLIKRNALKINHIKWLILDEADEMLNMGFRDDLDAILGNTPKQKQTLLFSATMPNGVRKIASQYMNNPEEISIGKKNTGAENVNHIYYVVKASDRYNALKRLADIHPDIYGIVFCRTRGETKEVAAKLIQDGYSADALHGELSQAQRDQVMLRFRSNKIQLLVATDVAARGLDINDLTHVINYNLPDDLEAYIHRSGRTGRAGKLGTSIIISHTREGRKIQELEKLVGKKFEHLPVPTGKEVCEKRLYKLMDNIENIDVNNDEIAPYMKAINDKLGWIDRDELLKRFVYVEFNRFLEYYKKDNDINVARETEFRSRNSGKARFSRFYINIGSKQHLKAPNLIGLINEKTRNRNIEIGKIDILKNFAFFEVDQNFEKAILNAFKNETFGSTKLSVELSKPDTSANKYNMPQKEKKRKKKKTKSQYAAY